MAVKIGHASIDERGKISGGQSGDQTGREVFERSYYKHPWIAVIRPNNSKVAEKIAKAMEQACANNKIGYDQSQRTTLYTQAKAKNWDISKITTPCETDCSATVAVCVNAAGISVSKDMYTGNEKAVLKNTGKFTVYETAKYTNEDTYLKRGDILLANGHTAIVLSNGSGVVNSTLTTTIKYYKKYTGNSVSIVEALKSVGADTSFTNRAKIAVLNGIVKTQSAYKGTSEQNTKILNLLKKGKLIKKK